jgi:hypothetical protein
MVIMLVVLGRDGPVEYVSTAVFSALLLCHALTIGLFTQYAVPVTTLYSSSLLAAALPR